MNLKTHDGHEVDPKTHRLVFAWDVLKDWCSLEEISKKSDDECMVILDDVERYLFSRPVLEWNWKNGRRYPYVNFTFLGLDIQVGWVFDEIPRPGRDVKPPRLPHSSLFLPRVGGSPLPKPEPKRLVCGFVPPTPGYAPCTRDKGHDGPCAHDFIRRRRIHRGWGFDLD